MNMLKQFTYKAPNRIVASIILGMIAGGCYATLIPTLLAAIEAPLETAGPFDIPTYTLLGVEISHYRLASWFAALCVTIWASRSLSQIILVRVAIEVAQDLRTSIFYAVSHAPIARLERVGLDRINLGLSADVGRVVAGGRAFPDIIINSITVLGVLGFILYLNSSVFWFTLAGILAGGITFQLPVVWGNRYFTRSRQVADEQAEAIRGLVAGAKELKINQVKRDRFFRDVLLHNERATAALEATGSTILRAAISYGDLINMLSVGGIAFILVNYRAIGQSQLTGVVMALLYLTGPVAMILGSVPQLAIGVAAQRRIAQLLSELPAENLPHEATACQRWRSLQFSEVRYRHLTNDETRAFEVGPLDFELRRGEVTFIVGGNGSGKSTIAKLVTMHYLPSSGTILLDGEALSSDRLQPYREEVCAVFSDYYLFDRLLDVPPGQEARITGYLSRLGLSDKVTLSKGHFSTLKLSDGQRRRLALLVAYIEDRSLYVFDEWAADQDPEFRRFFYEVLLPEMRDADKAVVAITHDDRYFHLADQVLRVEDGRVVSV